MFQIIKNYYLARELGPLRSTELTQGSIVSTKDQKANAPCTKRKAHLLAHSNYFTQTDHRPAETRRSRESAAGRTE